ncbi:MAG TPA: hypothetical protein VIV11_26970 [Kofleriaceae bacterium]
MTIIRSALFAGVAVAAGWGCQQRDRMEPAPSAPPASTETTTTTTEVYEPSVEPSPGTAAPYGHGALGGAAMATQEPGPSVEMHVEVTPVEDEPATVGTGPAAPATTTTPDRQARSITGRRRSTTNPSPSATPPPAELTLRPTELPADTTSDTPAETPTSEPNDTITSNPDPGISDTSTQSTRSNPDSQDQSIGGGDTYDRNR